MRIETQRQQWPHRVAALRRHADELTDSGAAAGAIAGTGLGVGYGRNDTATNFAQDAAGSPYEYGGSGPDSKNVDTGGGGSSWDCSGITGDLYSIFNGQDPGGDFESDATGERINTTSDFSAMGFEPGYEPGAYNIGVNPEAGSAGHMAGELPNGEGVESSSSDGVEYGSGARDVQSFPQQWHLPGSGEFDSGAASKAMESMTTPSDAGSTQALNNKTSRHRHAVPEHPSRKWLDDLMAHIEDNGWYGMTIKNAPGDAPTSGYMVSLPGHEESFPLDDLSGQKLLDYIHDNYELINSDPDHYLGGWLEANRWYSDVSRHHDRAKGLFPAATDAFRNDQLALYDIDNDQGIDTEEAGWMTGAPWKTGHRHDQPRRP